MAADLIRQWRLAALRVRLDVSGPEPEVVSELLDLRDGAERRVWSLRHPPSAYGINGFVGEPVLTVPEDLRDAVVSAAADEFDGRAALWLHLVPPYGYLCAVPWEQVLVPATRVPLLRVPERLPGAAAPGGRWTVAVVVNAVAGASWPARHLPGLARSLVRAVHLPLDLHIFADAGTAEALTRQVGEGPALHLHRPVEGEPANDGRPAVERWTGWLVDQLSERGVRVLHLLGDCVLDGDRPMFAVTADPAREYQPATASYLGADDLQRLADAIGAPAMSIGSPPGNPSDVASRVLANAVGVRRCGPTAYTCLPLDPDGSALAAAQGFLANPPGSTPLPVSPALFAYVQPELVQAAMAEAWPDERLATSPGEVVEELYGGDGPVPGWLATAARYLDRKVADRATGDPEQPAAVTKRAYAKGNDRALAYLRDVVSRYAGEP